MLWVASHGHVPLLHYAPLPKISVPLSPRYTIYEHSELSVPPSDYR